METRSRAIPVALADGSVIHVQATPLGGDEEITFGINSFEDVRKAIEGIAREINEVITAVAPRRATVEFSLNIAAESGKLTALLVQGSGTASMRITLEWGES